MNLYGFIKILGKNNNQNANGIQEIIIKSVMFDITSSNWPGSTIYDK